VRESPGELECAGGMSRYMGCARLFADLVEHSGSALRSSESSFLSNEVKKPKGIKVECGSSGRRSDNEEG
jgi:hypothetical protein